MKTNILDTERGKVAQANLKAILEAIAPFLPKPDVPWIQEPSKWSVSDSSGTDAPIISAEKNALACLN